MAVVAAMPSVKENSPEKPLALALPQTARIDWLLRSAAGVASPAMMLAEVCGRLIKERVPIAATLLTVASLDPLVARSRMRWRQNDGRVAEEIQVHGMVAVDEPPSKSVTLKFTLAGTQHHSQWLAGGRGGVDQLSCAYLEGATLA